MIFRKVALERLSSPEQLDQLIQVTSPRSWLALAGLGLLIVTALAWSVAGSIPTVATGEGILIRRGGVSELVATTEGQVTELLVEEGQLIERGQVVARLRQEELSRQIDDERERLEGLERELADMERYAEEQRRLRARSLEHERSNLRRKIEALETDMKILRERLREEEALLDDGLITRQALLESEREENRLEDQIAAERLSLSNLELERLDAEQQLDQMLDLRRASIRDQELAMRDLERRLEETTRVLSPYRGRALELLIDVGDIVQPGSPLLNLEVDSEDLIAVVFVPASDGKRIQPGMVARITPSTVKREEFGYMVGRVHRVADYPSTFRGIQSLLANDELVKNLIAAGPPIQIDIELTTADTPTGFLWSSSRGPNVTLSSGTLVESDIILREDAPIELVIPKIQQELGL